MSGSGRSQPAAALFCRSLSRVRRSPEAPRSATLQRFRSDRRASRSCCASAVRPWSRSCWSTREIGARRTRPWFGSSRLPPERPPPAPCQRRRILVTRRFGEERVLGAPVACAVAFDTFVVPGVRPVHALVCDPVVRSAGKTPVADRGLSASSASTVYPPGMSETAHDANVVTRRSSPSAAATWCSARARMYPSRVRLNVSTSTRTGGCGWPGDFAPSRARRVNRD